MLAKGETDADGKFSSLTTFSGLNSTFDWSDSAALTSNPTDARIFSINGNATSGFLTTGYLAASGVTHPVAKSALVATSAIGNICYGGDGTCAGVTALKPADDADMGFLLDPRSSSTLKAKAWFQASKPLTFETVTFAESQQ